jgi:glutamate-1-semialdehyde 2,1-aminomutase
MVSIFTTLYTQPGRYNWLLQYYLRQAGLAMSWVGTGRFIFSHDLSDGDLEAIFDRFVAGACRMRDDGWLWKGAEDNRAIRRGVVRAVVSARLKA